MPCESTKGPQDRVFLKYLTIRIAFFQRTHIRKICAKPICLSASMVEKKVMG